jgi:hypothetical protein
MGGEDVPCPFCSPEKPKFGRGRMAYFPRESVIRFVGHRCAKTHFGENYATAEQQFRRQETARRYIQLWKAVATDKDKIAELLETLLAVGEKVELVRREMERTAPGICKELYRELSNTAGELRVTDDLGMRDRHGKVVRQTQVIGTGAGLAFLRASFAPVKVVRRAKAALAATEFELPEWEPMTPEHQATEDILKLGRNLEKSLQDLPDARDAIEDAGRFLSAKNIRLLNRWGSAPSSPYAAFEMKTRGKQLVVRIRSFTGRYYANATVPEEKELKVPDAMDPAMAWAKGMATNG